MASVSSVDELMEPSDRGEDIVVILSLVLAFSAEYKGVRSAEEKEFVTPANVLEIDAVQAEKGEHGTESPKNMVELLSAAKDELEEATRRMD